MPEQRFLRNTSLKWKWSTNLDVDLKMTSTLQYSKVLSIACSSRLLSTHDFFLRNGETRANCLFSTTQIIGCLIYSLSKYIFLQGSAQFLG